MLVTLSLEVPAMFCSHNTLILAMFHFVLTILHSLLLAMLSFSFLQHCFIFTMLSLSQHLQCSHSLILAMITAISQHHVLLHTALFLHSLLILKPSCHYCSNGNTMCYVIKTWVSWIYSQGGSESCHQLWERYVVLSDASLGSDHSGSFDSLPDFSWCI